MNEAQAPVDGALYPALRRIYRVETKGASHRGRV